MCSCDQLRKLVAQVRPVGRMSLEPWYIYGLPDTAASTLLRLLKPRLISLREHLGGIKQIFPHCDVDVGVCLNEPFWGMRGRVLTLIKNISLVLRL